MTATSDHLPLILLPGMPLDADLWAHQQTHLGDVTPHIIIPDLTGADSVDALAASVLATAPDRFALAGLSMGGYVALAIMRQAAGRVSRLALLDTNARADTPEQSANRKGAIDMVRAGRLGTVVASSLPRLVHKDRLADSAFVARIQAQAERVGADGYIRQQTAIMNRPDSRSMLADIRIPTLVLCGRQDVVTPPDLHVEMADAIAGAQLTLIEECGHLSAMEQPQAVTALLRLWLTSPASGPV